MSGEIHSELAAKGYEITGVVSWGGRSQFYAVGYQADDLPDEVAGFEPIDDPSL